MPGHTPYIMPDGQPLSRYLTLDDDRRGKQKKKAKKGKGPRGKDELWKQLMLQKSRARSTEGGYGDGVAELENVQKVGHRRRRRWLNDRLLRDMAGPMTAKEMESHFRPPPWGDSEPLSLTDFLQESPDIWDILRNIDMDKESRLLKKWELHNAELAKKRRTVKGSKDPWWAAAKKALRHWSEIDKHVRHTLKRANPHSVLELEMELMEYIDKGIQDEDLEMNGTTEYDSQLWQGLADFHTMSYEITPSPQDPKLRDICIKNMAEKETDSSAPTPHVNPMEITCTDILLAMQEYRFLGLNARVLADFVKVQIHGISQDNEDDWVIL